MSKLTPKELTEKTVKDLTRRKVVKAKKAESDVIYVLITNKQKARRKKIGQL